METNSKNVNLGFTDHLYPAGTHICLIYSSEEERKKVISQFITEGVNSEEKVAYFTDEINKESVREWILEKISEAEKVKYKNINVYKTSEIYHPTGKFIPEDMLENIRVLYRDSVKEKYNGARLTGEMTWAVKGIPGSERLMEYESKINNVVKKFPVTAICQYDVNKFDGATILECLKVHPYMIVKSQIVENPYYLTTEEYLNEK